MNHVRPFVELKFFVTCSIFALQKNIIIIRKKFKLLWCKNVFISARLNQNHKSIVILIFKTQSVAFLFNYLFECYGQERNRLF